MQGHTIVYGKDALAVRIAEELWSAGVVVSALPGAEGLTAAGVVDATAIVCASSDDEKNLEIALLARQLNPTMRVIARLANDVLRAAVAADNGPGAVLSVADLTASSVVEACLRRTTHVIPAAGVDFIVSGATVPREGTLRGIYGDLAPVAVVHGEGSPTPGEVVACPGRDLAVREGDWAAMIGTEEELAAQGIVAVSGRTKMRRRRSPLSRLLDGVRAFRDDVNPIFFRALGVALGLLVGATVLLRYTYQRPGMSYVDALYFSTETIATVGYGDFSFVDQPTWLRLFSIFLMFAGIATTAVVMAFVVDLLLSRRIAQNSGRRKVRELSDHVIVVGVGSFGVRVATDLKAAGCDVVIIERSESNRYLATVTDLGIPVIFGDATLPQTWDAARLDEAAAVAVLTQDDVTNIETGIVVRNRLGARWSDVPLVVRVFDRTLGTAVAQRFGFENLRSTVELAAPWFIGAAMGLQVLGTFSVGQQSFTVGGVLVEEGSELAGMRMADLSTKTRVIAISRPGLPIRLHPRRDTRLSAGDTAYVVGPYRELLETLRGGRTVCGD
ncbi:MULTISPECIES: NAD-binding protein [Mycobacteroides]|uniref:Potassium transporter TrkA n=1 Tax=Mycobacteroides chelonae TaxID=1774 RepID=A0A1S1LNW8_MYCCH|nr:MULTISPECIES: NAD-binding protein [Mycobacteroides]KRQ20088.1 potassium transporter TrkA [Mycobacteroides sp. H003]KRQ35180.1 potassium transporter TrkA [Mycobacteroides sp. H092]KRQ46631.1 potassium transporter TrkA [Mycobacteroides sp. H101]KRQ52672.1 potassium transporter TrkA [Mycobacteroides sp. H063]KRQ59355.1 potassium transporter TrkA [Mycobacteroides sp. HXVII]